MFQEAGSRVKGIQILIAFLTLTVAIFLALVGANLVNRSQALGSSSIHGLHAITLISGKTYFGTVERANTESLRLKDVFYASTVASGAPTSTDISLVKMGSEFYKPEDWMEIPRLQIQYIQALREDGKVFKAIQDYRPSTP
jgi:hypothetical protein